MTRSPIVAPARLALFVTVAAWLGFAASAPLRGQDDGEPAAGGAGRGAGQGRAGRGATPAGGRSTVVTTVASFNQAQVARGRLLFLTQCASCHGLDARGGAGFTDVDLMRTRITYMDITGRELEAFLRTAHGSELTPQAPRPTPHALSTPEVVDIATWLRFEAADFVGGRGGPRHNVFSGDARAGEAFFNGEVGKCSTCHSVTGDLAGIGARANNDAPTLQAAILSGSAGGGARGGRGGAQGGSSVTATVTLENGQRFTGTPITVNNWLVEIRLADGTIRSWLPKNGWPRVERTNRLQPHVDLLFKYMDEDIRNLAAYLRDK